MKVIWRSTDQWRSFQGQWSFQGKRVTSDQWRSFHGQGSLQWSLQRSRVISRSKVTLDQWRSFVKVKGHFKVKWFQGQRVTSDQWRSRVISRSKDHFRSMKVIWRSLVIFKVKGSLQINEDHLKVNRSMKGIWRSRVISRSKGHFRSMKVISRSRVIAMATSKVKGHFRVKGSLQINEGHLNVKGTQFHVVDRRAAVNSFFFWQRCVWHQHQQQLQQLKRPLCSVRDAEHWIRLACTECYKLMNPPPTKEYNVAWSRIFNSIATSEQQPDMHHLTFHVTNSIWGERGFIPVPWLIHMSLQLCAIEKKQCTQVVQMLYGQSHWGTVLLLAPKVV